MIATKQQILSRTNAFTDVPCPELGDGVSVRITRLSVRQYMDLARLVKLDPDNAFAYWIAATATDEQGLNLFTAEEAKQLADVDYALVERLASAAIGGAKGEATAGKPTA